MKKEQEFAECPVCGKPGLFSMSQGGMITYVSSFDYEAPQREWDVDNDSRDIDVKCRCCGYTWESDQRFVMDWNNKFRKDESCEDGGWGLEFHRMLTAPQTFDEWESVAVFGLGLDPNICAGVKANWTKPECTCEDK